MKPYFKALPDDEGVDRVELVVVDRYKQSGLSGDEWRTSVVIRMFRKGEIVASDRWRCATRRQLKSVSCSCPCHGYIRATPEEGTQA